MLTGFRTIITDGGLVRQSGVAPDKTETVKVVNRRWGGRAIAFRRPGYSTYENGERWYTPSQYGVGLIDETGLCISVCTLPAGERKHDIYGRNPKQQVARIADGYWISKGYPDDGARTNCGRVWRSDTHLLYT